MTGIVGVARHAGVSTATVSRVLSNPDLVAEPTRQRVLAAIAELGYAPNPAAQSLRTLRVSKILLTVPDISNPFFSNIIRGAEAEARRAGYAIILGDTRHDPELENLYAAMLPRKEVDGLIFLGHRVPSVLEPIIGNGDKRAPIVNGCEFSPDMPVSSVHIDNAAAAGEAMEYLVKLGHRRIGIITGPPASPISRQRLEGAQAIAARGGAEAEMTVAIGDYSVESGFDRATDLIGQHEVTAIFCFSDEMAMGAVNAVFARGLNCPTDVSVIGFDDIRLARFVRPGLTTIAQPTAEIGQEAVKILLDIIAGRQLGTRHRTLPHRLVVRDSTVRCYRRNDDFGH